MKTHVIKINLSEGLFFNELWHVVGVYSHNLKILISKHPNTIVNDVFRGLSIDEMNEFEGYEILDDRTDSFSLAVWNPKTYSHTPLYEFVK